MSTRVFEGLQEKLGNEYSVWTEMHSSCVSRAAFVFHIYICGQSWRNHSDRDSAVALAPTECCSSRAEGSPSMAVAGSQRGGGLGSGCGQPWLFLMVEYASDMMVWAANAWPWVILQPKQSQATLWGILPRKPDTVSNEWIDTSVCQLLQLFCSPGAGKDGTGMAFLSG